MSDRISGLKIRIGFLDKLGRHMLDMYRIYEGKAVAAVYLDKAAAVLAKADVLRIELNRLERSAVA